MIIFFVKIADKYFSTFASMFIYEHNCKYKTQLDKQRSRKAVIGQVNLQTHFVMYAAEGHKTHNGRVFQSLFLRYAHVFDHNESRP